MIGNDIVDLAQAKQESNWQRKGFLTKLFTTHEQSAILQSSEPERMVWAFWTMKESAYKARLRETGKRKFAPKQIECQPISVSLGEIRGIALCEKQYQTQTVITPQYISSIAFSAHAFQPAQQTIISLTNSAYQAQSTAIREKIISHCAERLTVPAEVIQIKKDQNGIPHLIVSHPFIHIPLTISHHGKYGAYWIAFPD